MFSVCLHYLNRSATENQEKSQEEGRVGPFGQEEDELRRGEKKLQYKKLGNHLLREREGQDIGLKKDRHENCKSSL